MVELVGQQIEAKESVGAWLQALQNGCAVPQVFRLFGFAGTGKTTIAEQLISEFKLKTSYAAYTGKAALVMNKHGMPATTIHSAIYMPILPEEDYYNNLKRQHDRLVAEHGDPKKIAELKTDMREAQQIHFELNPDSPFANSELVVLDEVSMVNEELGQDVESFETPILVIGDPGQLPPIEGAGYYVNDQPDVMLTEIHRQAADSPIIQMSVKARKGIPISIGDWGESKCISKSQSKIEMLLEADQVLCGKNDTRMKFNKKIREMKGHTSPYPEVGERLICLRNKKKQGLLNGLQGTVKKFIGDYADSLHYLIEMETGREQEVVMLKAYFDEYQVPGLIKQLRWWDMQKAECFDYAYALTVHKAQGSQWDRVFFWDDGMFQYDRLMRRRWVYTGITRAAEQIIIAR